MLTSPSENTMKMVKVAMMTMVLWL